MSSHTRNNLTDKILRWTEIDEKGRSIFFVRRFVAPVSADGDIWLMEHLCPEHGESIDSMLLMRLSDIVTRKHYDAEIFEDVDTYLEHERLMSNHRDDEDEIVPEKGVLN
jgi:hypothetical protein